MRNVTSFGVEPMFCLIFVLHVLLLIWLKLVNVMSESFSVFNWFNESLIANMTSYFGLIIYGIKELLNRFIFRKSLKEISKICLAIKKDQYICIYTNSKLNKNDLGKIIETNLIEWFNEPY